MMSTGGQSRSVLHWAIQYHFIFAFFFCGLNSVTSLYPPKLTCGIIATPFPIPIIKSCHIGIIYVVLRIPT